MRDIGLNEALEQGRGSRLIERIQSEAIGRVFIRNLSFYSRVQIFYIFNWSGSDSVVLSAAKFCGYPNPEAGCGGGPVYANPGAPAGGGPLYGKGTPASGKEYPLNGGPAAPAGRPLTGAPVGNTWPPAACIALANKREEREEGRQFSSVQFARCRGRLDDHQTKKDSVERRESE